MTLLAELYEEAFGFAERAIRLEDEDGKESMSMLLLQEAVESFLRVLELEADEKKKELVRTNVSEWMEKIQSIKKRSEEEPVVPRKPVKKLFLHIQLGLFSLEQAIAEEEKQNSVTLSDKAKSHIADLYLDAAENFLLAIKSEEVSQAWKKKLQKQLAGIVERGEELKGIKRGEKQKKPIAGGAKINQSPSELASSRGRRPAGRPATLKKVTVAEGGLTMREKEVLMNSSEINGRLFLPFMEMDENEKYTMSAQFVDTDAPLKLDKAQREKFSRWMRAEDAFQLYQEPTIVELISPFSITQSVIGDCSFVSSLTVCAMYERIFRQPILTSKIYPQNRFRRPIYNPRGKYVVKLTFNGIERKVIIDDTLPVGRNNEVLTSTSKQKGELWVSLVEKAYMKIHGGYDFPGSNSGIDLHALLGWIPERMTLSKRDDVMVQWDRLMDGRQLGQCLLTVSTQKLSKEVADGLGIVPSHAYAILDIRKVHGFRLMKLKNPWSYKRWRGRFSEYDTESWTPQMQKALNFDLVGNRQNDNGVFWIDYESVCQYFPELSISWNPSLFEHHYVIHSKFEKGMPPSDVYSFERNPQFSLTIGKGKPGQEDTLWILLNKHVRSTEEKRADYVTLHVFDNAGGRKVYQTNGALIQGTYINSPFYLIKHNVPSTHPRKFTVVVSQHEASREISFSLFFYCTALFKTTEIPVRFPNSHAVRGRWTEHNAGGSTNNPTYEKNPKYLLSLVPNATAVNPQVFVKLETTKELYVSVKLYKTDSKRTFNRRNLWKDSGDYRKCFCFLDEILDVPSSAAEKAQVFVVVPSTFDQGQLGDFVIGVGSKNCDVSLCKM